MKQMNRAMALFLALVLVLGMFPVRTLAEEAGSGISWTVENGVMTISGSGNMWPEDSFMPEGWPYGDGITAVVVEEGVTDVASFAFEGFEELTTVTLADTVETVGYAAFQGCSALTEVHMPYGVHVSMDAFTGTSWLENLPRDESGFAIHKGIVLHYNGEAQDIEIPDSVVSIAGGFSDTKLNSVLLPDSVVILGDYAFYNQKNLKQVNFPNGLRYVGDYAFESAGLLEAMLPESVEYLGDGAFGWCGKLTAASVPGGLTYLGASVFRECGDLVDVTLGEGIEVIPDYMFCYCDSLQEVELPDTITCIGYEAFARCYALKEIVIPVGVIFIGYSAFWDCWNMTAVVLPEGLVTIASSAFDGCNRLEQMNLPDSLETFSIDGMENTPWVQNKYDDNGYAVEGQWLLSYRGSDSSVVIPDSVKRIAGYALDACANVRNITSVKLPDGLEYIGVAAFEYCTGLTALTIPDSVTFIDEVAFYGCSGLESLVIPDSVTTLEHAAFAWCQNLKELTLSANLTWIPDDCFRGCESLQSVEIPDGVTYIGHWAFYDCTDMQSITIPASVTTIEDEAVGYCTDPYYFDYSTKISGFTIYGYGNSAAHTYARVNNFTFVDLNKPAEHFHQYYPYAVIDPTCTEPGYTIYTCECGDSYTDDYVDPLGHDYDENICTRCGAEDPDHQEPVENPFTDVPAGSFYEAPVLWAVEYGITNGASADSFNPDGECQRAHVVTFLWRAAGEPEPTSTENPFVDVTETDFYYKAVLWAVENSITNGVDASHFGPFTYCNRAQVVTFLYRAMQNPEIAGGDCPFTDVEAGQWYENAIIWAVENGVTNGMSSDNFGVDTVCNRAQVVTFLYRTYVN